MRAAPLIAVMLFSLVTSTAALAGGLSRLSLTMQGGASSPSEIDDRSTLGLGDGSSLGARLGFAVAPSLRLTAGISRERLDSGTSLIMIPEIRLRSIEPVRVTTALVGLEATTPLPRPARGPQVWMYFGLASGQAWLGGGERRFDDMNGPSFTVAGVNQSAPVVGADLGVRVATGLSRLAVDLGWNGLLVRSRDHPMTVQAVRVGLAI